MTAVTAGTLAAHAMFLTTRLTSCVRPMERRTMAPMLPKVVFQSPLNTAPMAFDSSGVSGAGGTGASSTSADGSVAWAVAAGGVAAAASCAARGRHQAMAPAAKMNKTRE